MFTEDGIIKNGTALYKMVLNTDISDFLEKQLDLA